MNNKKPIELRESNPAKFYILHFTFFILFFAITSCTTEPQTGNLSGNIQLEGEQDHSGITLAVS